MKVYVVLFHGWFTCSDMGQGDTIIQGVFATEEKAEEYLKESLKECDNRPEDERYYDNEEFYIEEYELDKGFRGEQPLLFLFLKLYFKGEVKMSNERQTEYIQHMFINFKTETCICCGREIPEGIQVCYFCSSFEPKQTNTVPDIDGGTVGLRLKEELYKLCEAAGFEVINLTIKAKNSLKK